MTKCWRLPTQPPVVYPIIWHTKYSVPLLSNKAVGVIMAPEKEAAAAEKPVGGGLGCNVTVISLVCAAKRYEIN